MQISENTMLVLVGFLAILLFSSGWAGIHALYYKLSGEQQTINEMANFQATQNQQFLEGNL